MLAERLQEITPIDHYMIATYNVSVKTKWRFRCYPTLDQTNHLGRTFGCCRVVYNHFLRIRTDAYRIGRRAIGYAETDRLLTALKKQEDYSWLNDVSSVPLQQALRHLQTAFVSFFEKRTGYPAFKKKTGRQSATYARSAFRWDAGNRRLLLAKVGRLKVRWSRDVTVEPSTVTITKSPSGRYHVTLTLDIPEPEPLPKTGVTVGIDLGVNRLATLSTGERAPNPRHLGKNLEKLARLQRILSRRIRDSGRYRRQLRKVARLHERIADSRKDTLDKLTTRLVQEFDVLCIEDLNVLGMLRSTLSRSLSDAALGTFRRMLEYKAKQAGKVIRVVDRFFPSSQLCSRCGHRNSGLKRNEVRWTCLGCGAEHDRDDNAAANLKAAGHAVSARGGAVSHPGGPPPGCKPR
jgi:putative transposase